VTTQDQVLLAALVKAVDDVDVETFQALLKRVGFDQRYWHQLCHWLHHVKCRRKCRKMCPNLPSITKVGLIPASQINAAGYGAGPSVPVGPTPADSNSPGPYGDHVWGAQTFIQGSIFGIANVAKYRVESRITAGPGPWVPMLNPVPDFDAALLPGNPDFLRVPDAQGWFLVSDMKTYIADLAYMTTTAGPDGPYQLRLTVENGIGQQFSSGLIPIRVDNTGPTDFTFVITQSGDPLPCCGSKVVQENGPLKITVTGWDTNFAAMSITLRGGCNESYPVFSKTYDGDVTDTGAPPPGITFDYDPWAAGVKPCCYVLDVEVVDRAIVDNTLYAAHRVSSVRSITIA
jgi:hypothetical protein